MPAQTSGNVGQNRVAVVKLDRERRAGKHLLDATVNLERLFLGVDAVGLDFTWFFWRAIASSDNNPLLCRLAAAAAKCSTPRLWFGFKTIPGSGIA